LSVDNQSPERGCLSIDCAKECYGDQSGTPKKTASTARVQLFCIFHY
jgi:hypothetical protein